GRTHRLHHLCLYAREPLRLAPRVVAARGRLPQAPQGPAPHPEPRDSRGRRARRLARLMRGPGRISQGLLTDATRPVGFRFDGRRMSGLAGDTLEAGHAPADRKSTRLNSSHDQISYAVFCLKKKININVRYHVKSLRSEKH